MKPHHIAAIDQGTTGTTVIVFDEHERIAGRAYREIPQSYPRPGWVEHDPEAIWTSVEGALAEAVHAVGGSVDAIGITNQRETTVLWDRATGVPVAPAIVWQDRRTSDACDQLRRAGREPEIVRLTGLLIDPYFSATKIAWLLDHVPGLRARAEAGAIAFGTVDSYLIWRLSGGAAHVTDVSNASRTQILDLESRAWSPALCALFRVPHAILPEVKPSAGLLATTAGIDALAGAVPITGVAGDQQAALYGQGCVRPGDAKCTFGTGSFLLMNVGDRRPTSAHRLLSTVAWTLAAGGPTATAYALEGGAFICGALVQWLRDGLGLFARAADIEAMAAGVPDSGGVTIVPAFAGLGAPHWQPGARGIISGLTRGTTRAHIARAALEAMALQNVDIVRAMEADAGRALGRLAVDGGAAANDLLMQLQADLLDAEIVRPAMLESTALGAARLGAVGAGLMSAGDSGPGEKTAPRVFTPAMTATQRAATLARWQESLARAGAPSRNV
jgi:glycerol kinase